MCKILVIDDDESIHALLCEEIRSQGIEHKVIEFATSGEEGIEIVKTSRPKFIFLDMKMPGMCGNECFKRIKLIDPTATVFLMTGYRDDDEISNMIKSGIDGYIAKQGNYVKMLTSLIISVLEN